MSLSEMAKTALREMVDYQEQRRGSREVAYRAVAKAIGASASWVRKWLAGDPTVSEPRLSLFESIRTAYCEMCLRVEREHEAELQRITMLRGELHAVDKDIRALTSRARYAHGT